jgi:hypothetical protein
LDGNLKLGGVDILGGSVNAIEAIGEKIGGPFARSSVA